MMNRTILLAFAWSVSFSFGWASESLSMSDQSDTANDASSTSESSAKAVKKEVKAEISNNRTTQFKFSGPEGMQIGWQLGQAFTENHLQPPARYNFPQGGTYHLLLRSIPEHESLTIYLTITVLHQTEGDEVFHYLEHNSVPVQFTLEDINHVESNNNVTKVFYRPYGSSFVSDSSGVEFLDSTQVKPGTDVQVEAKKLGVAIALIELANREVQVSAPPSSVKQIAPTNTDTALKNSSSDTPSDHAKDSTEVRFFHLRYSQAPSTVILLKELISDKSLSIMAEDRTNSVVVSGTADQLLAVETLLLTMDEAEVIDGQVTELRKAYEFEARFCQKLAAVLRQVQVNQDPAMEAQFDANKSVLRERVQKAFTLRQSLLRAELVQMQNRLLQTQQSIDMRERMADQIVDRRIEDLLNPQLNSEQSCNSDPSGHAESEPPKQLESRVIDDSGVVTELEGDWHLISATDENGKAQETRPENISFRKDQYTRAYPSGHLHCRVEIDPRKNEIKYFEKGDDRMFGPDKYLLEVDKLTLYRNSRKTVYQRGSVPFPPGSEEH